MVEKSTRKGIPKSRIPEGLEGLVVKIGKVDSNTSNKKMFSINFKKLGTYIFQVSDAKKFEVPKDDEKIYCGFVGQGKYLYYPQKVCDKNGQVFYEKR